MITQGSKNIETRTWYTEYRGDLLICSTLSPDLPGFKCGFALCVVNLKNCRPMIPSDAAGARCEFNEYPKLFAWVLTDLREIVPFGVRGHQRIFEVEVEDFEYYMRDKKKKRSKKEKPGLPTLGFLIAWATGNLDKYFGKK